MLFVILFDPFRSVPFCSSVYLYKSFNKLLRETTSKRRPYQNGIISGEKKEPRRISGWAICISKRRGTLSLLRLFWIQVNKIHNKSFLNRMKNPNIKKIHSKSIRIENDLFVGSTLKCFLSERH